MVAVLFVVSISPSPTCPKSPPPYTEPFILEYVPKSSTSTLVSPDVISPVVISCSYTFISKINSTITSVLVYTVALIPFPPPNTFLPI